MTTPPAAPTARPRPRRTPAPYDPALASIEGEEHGRLVFRCPSRRANSLGYLLACDEDGGRPSCSCDGAHFAGRCLHMTAAPAIVRVAYADHYATLTEAELVALDRELTARFAAGPVVSSLRYDCLGEELAKRARMKDRPLLNLRGQRAKSELFGEIAG